MFELTGSLDALLATSIVSIVSYVTANILKTDPFYEHLLANLLGVTPDDPDLNGQPGEKVIHSFVVGAGSKLDGRCIRDVEWPKNTLVVTVERAGTEILPTRDTRLQALDELMVLMDTRYEDDRNKELRALCRGSLVSASSPGQ